MGLYSNNPTRRRRSKKGGGFEVQTFVTGDKEVDGLLNGLPIKAQKKHFRKATRKASKENLKDFRDRVPVETGALKRVATVRSAGRSRTQVGAQVHIDREKLILERAARGGKIGFDKKRNEPFFYAAEVEFDPSGPMPLRKALYEGAKRTRKIVIESLKDLLYEEAAKARAQLREVINEISSQEKRAQ